MTVGEQAIDQVGPDEPATPEDQRPHRPSPVDPEQRIHEPLVVELRVRILLGRAAQGNGTIRVIP